MTAEITTAKRVVCPACGTNAKRVSPVTLRALLKDHFAIEISDGDHSCCGSNDESCTPITEDTGWRFCDSTDCDVVYFSEEGNKQFTKPHLKVSVGVKETTGERLLCYCFGHSVASIQEELLTIGRSDALEYIRSKMKDPGCHCETSNPSGSCCLGNVTKGIRIAREELRMNDSHVTPASKTKSSTGSGEKIAKIGTVISAILSSACCWLPLLLLAVGVSGAGIAATLETYRPLFMVVTFGFLGAAFYFTYRPRKAAATTEHACCGPQPAEGESCCPPTGRRRFNMMALNKVMLWGVAAMAVVFLFFPSYVGLLLGTDNHAAVTGNMKRAVFQVEGMTCEGCTATVAYAIRQVPGVVAVDASYEKKQAVVRMKPGILTPKEEILTALKKAGYTGVLLTTEESSVATDIKVTASTPSPESSGQQLSIFPSESLRQTVVTIEGMTCNECAAVVSEAIDSVPGVLGVHVDFKSGRASVQSPACCTFPKEAVLSAVEQAGFKGKVNGEETHTSTSNIKK